MVTNLKIHDWSRLFIQLKLCFGLIYHWYHWSFGLRTDEWEITGLQIPIIVFIYEIKNIRNVLLSYCYSRKTKPSGFNWLQKWYKSILVNSLTLNISNLKPIKTESKEILFFSFVSKFYICSNQMVIIIIKIHLAFKKIVFQINFIKWYIERQDVWGKYEENNFK